jgi:hypothetical protein
VKRSNDASIACAAVPCTNDECCRAAGPVAAVKKDDKDDEEGAVTKTTQSVSESLAESESQAFLFEWDEPTKPFTISVAVAAGDVIVYVSTDPANTTPTEANHDYKIEMTAAAVVDGAAGGGGASGAPKATAESASPPIDDVVDDVVAVSTSPVAVSLSLSPPVTVVDEPRRRLRRLLAAGDDDEPLALSVVVQPLAVATADDAGKFIYINVVGGNAGGGAGDVSSFKLEGVTTEPAADESEFPIIPIAAGGGGALLLLGLIFAMKSGGGSGTKKDGNLNARKKSVFTRKDIEMGSAPTHMHSDSESESQSYNGNESDSGSGSDSGGGSGSGSGSGSDTSD